MIRRDKLTDDFINEFNTLMKETSFKFPPGSILPQNAKVKHILHILQSKLSNEFDYIEKAKDAK